MQTALIYSPKYLEHDPGRDHPESPNRLEAILEEIEANRMLETGKCFLLEPSKAKQEVLLVHDYEYVQLVKQLCIHGGGLLDLGDTVASPKSYEAALQAVGGTIKAVDLIMQKHFKNAFVLCRPPGHHAGAYYACGFCIFNNVAVAAKYLLKRYGLKRVSIIDIDAHHGNGTQDIFYKTKKVLYISLHQDPHGFPGVGFADEVGEGEGLGYNVNIPFPFRTSDKPYLAAMKEIVEPIVQQYKPEFILVSAGLDAHYSDPVARLSLTIEGYKEAFKSILGTAHLSQERIVTVLEGGYSLQYVGKIAVTMIAQMAGVNNIEFQDRKPVTSKNTDAKAERIIERIKKIQAFQWKL
jgi:acetoin utilization deacetylase AcuC-like enzyme